MTLTELLQNAQFVINAQGQTRAVQLELPVWEELLSVLQSLPAEAEATQELLAIPGLVEAVEHSRQRVQAGQFSRYEDLRRNV